MSLNAAYADEIVQEGNSTYQLSFRFPTSDSLWEQLKEETFLTADDIHGEQDFVIFEVEKKHGYIQVYANQVFTLLNNYVVSSLTLDQATGSTALSRFAGAITRNNPFSFFSDIEDRHTFNIGSKNAMEAFAKDKHSILGQWGGDLVRHGYQVRLLKNGGSENESLFMYKKNLSSYQHKTSTKSLKTRITFKTTVKGEGEKAPDRTFTVTIDSPLINKYSQIYENVIEVNDQDVKDEASLRKYGEQYFRTTLCDMMEDSLELEVVGQSDVPVQMFDIVSLFHDVYNLDVRKKITKYTYSPMGKKLKTIGFGQFKSGLANAIGNAVSDAVKGEAQQLQSDFERQLARELKNANLAFDRQKEEFVNQFTDGLNAAKARAEEVKRELSDTINQRFDNFDNASIQEAKRRAEEALRNAGVSSILAQEAKRISERARADITNLQASSQNALSQIESFKTQYGTKLNEVKSTADGLFTKLGAIETYVNKDGQRQESLQRYARDESARQVSAVREQLSRDYVGKSTYQEDVRGLERRFSAISTQMNNDMTTKIAQYKQTVDGQFASITSQIAGKANQVDFQRVRETSQLYERIIGRNENDISNKVARMAMTNQLFQVEVSKNEGLKTVQRQIAGSWSVRNINSAGDLISGINLGANGHNRLDGKLTHITGETLIDKAVIKSAMVDKLKTANFEAGSVTTTILDTEAVTADKVLMDQAFANKLVASNIFTDMLAAKEAFINKLRSVVVTATFLEGFQGKIGGFRFGQYTNRNGYFITGINSVSIGMGNGMNAGANRNAFWANWGESLDTPGPKAWYVNTDGKMYCRNDVDFYSKVDFASTSKVNFYSRINAPRGIWIGYDDVEGEGDNPDGGYNRVVWWSQIVTGKWRQHAGITIGSDRKLKENIEPTSVKALDKINALNLVAFDYIKDKTHEETGLIAQEVLDIIPGAVEKYEGEDNHLTINYSKFVPYLIKAVQELNQKLEEIA
nr:MAG TPA: Neck appendage protein [Caudoviricetes sp.]